MNRQYGNTIVSILKLLVMIILAYLVVRTHAHLDEKYEHATPPPTAATSPVNPPPNKVK